MSFKDDFRAFCESRGKKVKGTKETLCPRDVVKRAYRYVAPRSKSKPNLIDPNAKSGPVKIYTREEIEAYERAIKGN